MKHKFRFDEDTLQWKCWCGVPVVELDFKVMFYHSLEAYDNTDRKFQSVSWDITSSLHCQKCGNLFTNPDDYKLDFGDEGGVGIILEGKDEAG